MTQPIRVYRNRRETFTRKPFFKPKLIFKADGKSVVTNSKWYPDQRACVRDWFLRGFIVIEDESIGGGFEVEYFPNVDLSKISDTMALRFKKKETKND